ncbi:peptidylprolyl isomerase [uncultured Paraglaciecola sp.]|uniref:peptidylprolyl isomerase n=1 Tax=uncultured Paraglaciecola sp. TaxID=1765024 RepID=UPI0030D87D8C
MIRKLFQDPLVLFVFFGALVFSIYAYLEQSDNNPVELSDRNRQLFTEQFELLTGRQATQADIAKIENDYIQEEILFREALEAGIHLGNPEIRGTLVEEMRYQATGIFNEPTEEQLVQYYLKHIQRYVIEPAISFQHVFFNQSPDKSMLTLLANGEKVTGDEFWRGRILPDYGISMIRGMFGKDFLERLQTEPLDTWYGPQKSMLGWHFVKVIGTQAASPLTFAEAKMQVQNDYTVDAIATSIDDYISQFGDKYQVIRHVN